MTWISKDILDAWPNCATPDCPNKVCTWGSESLCYPHEERIVGKAEMDRRYDLTHERDHTEKDVGPPNYMIKTYAEIQE